MPGADKGLARVSGSVPVLFIITASALNIFSQKLKDLSIISLTFFINSWNIKDSVSGLTLKKASSFV
jgi:hypothetical protein